MILKRIAKRLLYEVGLQPLPPQSKLKQVIAKLLPPSPVIVEAGAHDGTDTLQMTRAIPGCTIHAFEPIPSVFDQLTERTKHLPNVHRYPVALGEKKATQKIFVSGGGSTASSSLLAPKEHLKVNPHITFNDGIDVRVTTLDDWAAENSVSKVDFFWFDMQGYEPQALQGAKRLLETVKAVLTEVSLIEGYEGATLYHDLRAWMEDSGFRVHLVDFQYSDSGDVLFVRE